MGPRSADCRFVGKSFPQENVHGLELKPMKFFTKAQKCSSNRPFIHDTCNLCARFRTDRIKKMSRGFSGGKQVIKCANARNRGRVCIFQPTENEEHFILRTMMANYGWKSSLLLFQMRLGKINNSTAITRISKFCHLFAPRNTS